MTTICILYGINEGPGIGRAFEIACQKRKLHIVHDPAAADTIFAHSGGCLLVPVENQAKLIMQVGIPYWPGRVWLFATGLKIWREANLYHQEHQLRAWGRKLLWHARYAGNLGPAFRMARSLNPSRPWNNSQYQVVVRNRNDVYCCPEVHQVVYKGPRAFVSLPGEHDDCWEHPERYLDLLQSVYEQRSGVPT
jgi:hypothetical protein